MSVEPTTPGASASASPAVVVFGVDDKGKPHASTFKSEEAELAERAAGLMGMHVFRPIDADHLAAVEKLPVGRVFSSGRAFVPFCRRGAFDQLCALTGQDSGAGASKAGSPANQGTASPVPIQATTVPQTWQELGNGGLCLACDDPWDGWWIAVILSVEPDDALALRWRDFPESEAFARRRDEIGLLPSGTPLTSLVEQEAAAAIVTHAAKNKS